MQKLLTVVLSLSICLATGVASAQTSDLMISEYVEGSGNNKALEIYNGTEDTINLSGYTIQRYSNGATTFTTITLNAVDLEPDAAFVIANPSAAAELLALADQTDSNINFNGNDALVLAFGGSVVVDSIGRVGEDPGTAWTCPDGSTANHSLRRLSSTCTGDTTPDDVFDLCAEWSFAASDVFSGLGEHIADCGAVINEAQTWGELKAHFR